MKKRKKKVGFSQETYLLRWQMMRHG